MRNPLWMTLVLVIRVKCLLIDSQDCPEIFKYKESNGFWSGVLKVPIPKSGMPIHVQIHLSLNRLLTSKYVGLIELSESAETVIERILDEEITSVEYNVLFPIPYPLPVIKSVVVNEQQLCTGAQVSGNIVTSIKLEHEFPTNFNLIHSEYIKSKYGTEINCGEFTAPIEASENFNRIRWPWLVAILIRTGKNRLQFHCTGTLISHLYVLTAAHCFSKELKLNIEDIILYTGKHDLSNFAEEDSHILQAKLIHIHPEFRERKYNADIAVIQLSRPVSYGKFVMPMCLWQGDIPLEPLVGKEGIVVGWGKDGAGGFIKSVPRMVKLPVVNQEDCLRSQVDFHYITSSKTFCAGARNGKGPCNGDSGSAIIYQNLKIGPNHWHLRGIISLSLINKDKNSCDLHQFTVFTDVAKFLPWLESVLANQSY